MSESADLQILVHESKGIHFLKGIPKLTSRGSLNNIEEDVKSFCFSSNGRRFAWISTGKVNVCDVSSGNRLSGLQDLRHPRAQEICLSPLGNYLAVWDIYVKKKEDATPTPNLSVYDLNGSCLLKAFFQQSQVNWQPQWTADEAIFTRIVTNEVHFYAADNLQTIAEKKILPKVRSFSLSPSTGKHCVMFFVPGLKGAPANVHLHRYPDFQDPTRALANRSFFKVDNIDVLWNSSSTAALLLTSSEVDKSGSSYYGEQMLFYMNTSGESARVTFSQSGTIHSMAWHPNGHEFFAVYGFMPSRASLFNHNCDVVAEFGTGAFNTVSVNPIGNVVMLGGFGNISGRFEMWDVSARKKIGEHECQDSTHQEWSPCGQFLLTATCAPRLRVNNGYKIWHYTCVLQHETAVPSGVELRHAVWCPDFTAAKPFPVSHKPVNGIVSQTKTASSVKYVPPSQRVSMALRGGGEALGTGLQKKFLSQINDPTPAVEEPQLSKSAIKSKKKREAAKKKREEEGTPMTTGASPSEENRSSFPVTHVVDSVDFTGDPEKDKKIRAIKKKLDAIGKLKNDQIGGKSLEKNQLEKIAGEEVLLRELKTLTV